MSASAGEIGSGSCDQASALMKAWGSLASASLALLEQRAMRVGTAPEILPFDAWAPLRNWAAFASGLLPAPLDLPRASSEAFEGWVDLWSVAACRVLTGDAQPVIAPARSDRRFSDPSWSEQPLFDFIKQAYLLVSQQTLTGIERLGGADLATRTRVDFYARQLLNALSPANFLFTNPEALRRTAETGGANLIAGLANMLADMASPQGLVQRRSADSFELGVNIAATPGSVVHQNELMQLIQYHPSTEKVFRAPILYIPPLVNKYYLLDLKPQSSLIRWLVDQGHTVFVVSWVNPTEGQRDLDLGDYVRTGVIAALRAIEGITGERPVDVFSFCMGGVISALALGCLAATGEADRAKSFTMIGTMLDFSDLGEWSTFIEPEQLKQLERYLAGKGFIDAHVLQALFSAVRANDLIWPSVVNHYLLDRQAPESDLLFWLADGARMPERFLLSYCKALFVENRLREPGGVAIDAQAIDLARVTTPTMVISLKDDHVSSWSATYSGARLFGGPVTFMLGGSGHNAGLINPPSANKHGFWTNDALPETAEDWFEGAEKRPGSWWPTWRQWLTRGDLEDKTPARKTRNPIEAAPGSYVRQV
jgi:polyhydroxyalkanoate synthase